MESIDCYYDTLLELIEAEEKRGYRGTWPIPHDVQSISPRSGPHNTLAVQQETPHISKCCPAGEHRVCTVLVQYCEDKI